MEIKFHSHSDFDSSFLYDIKIHLHSHSHILNMRAAFPNEVHQ